MVGICYAIQHTAMSRLAIDFLFQCFNGWGLNPSLFKQTFSVHHVFSKKKNTVSILFISLSSFILCRDD